MKNTKKLLSLLLTAILFTSVFTGCSGGSSDSSQSDSAGSAASKEKITINLGTMGANPEYIIAKEKGYIEEELPDYDVEVNLNLFANGAEITSALASGDIDFGVAGDQPALAAVAADYGVINIGLEYYSENYCGIYAVKDSGIESIEDLKGKKVGVTNGTSQEYMFYEALESANLSKDDVEIINSKDLVTLIKSGEVDAILFNISACGDILADGTAYVVAYTGDYGVLLTTWYNARKEYITENPEVAAAVLKALDKAKDYTYADENRDEVVKTVSEFTQLSETVINNQLDYTVATVDIPESAVEAASNLLDFLKTENLIDNDDITIEDTIDYTYLELAGIRK